MVQEIIIYPVKSLAGTSKTGWETTKTGFLYDRHWMLTDENGQFLTQRELPLLCTFTADILDNEVKITHGENFISWSLEEFLPEIRYTNVWDDEVAVHPVHPLVDEFFSDQLHQKVFLVKQSRTSARKHTVSAWQKNIDVSLADGYPYLIVGTSSVRLLSEKSGRQVSFKRFRPNLVISTAVPHEEDSWSDVRIGAVRFRNVKPCARCQVVNIDPADGTSDTGILKELSVYRKEGFKVNFGTLMVTTEDGFIRVGDEVEVYENLADR